MFETRRNSRGRRKRPHRPSCTQRRWLQAERLETRELNSPPQYISRSEYLLFSVDVRAVGGVVFMTDRWVVLRGFCVQGFLTETEADVCRSGRMNDPRVLGDYIGSLQCLVARKQVPSETSLRSDAVEVPVDIQCLHD